MLRFKVYRRKDTSAWVLALFTRFTDSTNGSVDVELCTCCVSNTFYGIFSYAREQRLYE